MDDLFSFLYFGLPGLGGGGIDWLLADGDAVAAYSLRKLRANYSGQCIRLRRSSDNAESDIAFSSNGNVDGSAITAFLGAASAFVVTWYDQSGNAQNVTQTTAANQPALILNGLNGHPVLSFDGSNDTLSNTSFADFGDNYSAYIVAKYASAGNADATQGLFDVSTGALNTGFSMYHESTAKANARAAAGPVVADSTADLRDGVFRIHDMANTGSQLQYRRNNGTAQTVAYTAPNPNTLTRLDIGRFGQLANYILNGSISELVLRNVTDDATARGNIISNIDTYWDVINP